MRFKMICNMAIYINELIQKSYIKVTFVRKQHTIFINCKMYYIQINIYRAEQCLMN